MLTQVFGNLVFILLLVCANAFFVAAEFAIVKVRSSQILERIKSSPLQERGLRQLTREAHRRLRFLQPGPLQRRVPPPVDEVLC